MNRIHKSVAQLYFTCRMASPSYACPDSKRPKLDQPVATEAERKCFDEEDASKTNVVLVLCGSMNPITFLHLRMFGES